VKVDGFRQGHVPENIAKEKIGKENLLMEAGDLAVNDVYKKFVRENNLEPVGQPEVQILKIAEGNPFLFKLTITVLPEIHLPDYKEIAAKIKSKEISVTEEEIQDALNYLQKTRAKFTAENRPAAKKDFVEIVYQNKDVNEGKEVNDRFVLGEGGFMKEFEENVEGMKAGDEKSFKAKFPENSPRKDLAGKEADFKVSMKSVQKMELSEINDEFAKGLGAFDTLVSLKTSIKEGINQEKTEAEKQRMRGEILSKITEQTKFDIPEKMVDYEKDKLFDNMKHQITEHYKLTFQNYLASIKKTEKEIKETFQKDAEKRIRDYLVL
jgi:trigger factor